MRLLYTHFWWTLPVGALIWFALIWVAFSSDPKSRKVPSSNPLKSECVSGLCADERIVQFIVVCRRLNIFFKNKNTPPSTSCLVGPLPRKFSSKIFFPESGARLPIRTLLDLLPVAMHCGYWEALSLMKTFAITYFAKFLSLSKSYCHNGCCKQLTSPTMINGVGRFWRIRLRFFDRPSEMILRTTTCSVAQHSSPLTASGVLILRLLWSSSRAAYLVLCDQFWFVQIYLFLDTISHSRNLASVCSVWCVVGVIRSSFEIQSTNQVYKANLWVSSTMSGATEGVGELRPPDAALEKSVDGEDTDLSLFAPEDETNGDIEMINISHKVIWLLCLPLGAV